MGLRHAGYVIAVQNVIKVGDPGVGAGSLPPLGRAGPWEQSPVGAG